MLPLLGTMLVEDRLAQLPGGPSELPAPLPSLPKLLKAHVLVAPRLMLLYALRRLQQGHERRLLPPTPSPCP